MRRSETALAVLLSFASLPLAGQVASTTPTVDPSCQHSVHLDSDHGSQPLKPMHTRCWLWCGSPPAIHSAVEAAKCLSDKQNPKITTIAKTTSVLTTPLGKLLGIRGWRDYGFRVAAVGNVVAAAGSWDRLKTIDLHLSDFGAEDGPLLGVAGKYLRLEVFPRVHLKCLPEMCAQIRVRGRLVWDGDGFLEVHPERPGDIEIKCAQ